MKLLLDFLPIILFFATFKWAEARPDEAARWASEHLGFLVQGGVVGPAIAPVLLATVVVMGATAAQVVATLARGRKVDALLWVSLVLVVGLGAATVWFHSETFIKWKPTVLYWIMAASLMIGQVFWGNNLIKNLLENQVSASNQVWQKLLWAWFLFFATMGALNLWIAYTFSTSFWVSFKLFGFLGLILVFIIGQTLYLSKQSQPS